MSFICDTRQHQLPITNTLIYSFYAFMTPALLIGLLGGPVGLMIALVFGGMVGVPVAVAATVVWALLRRFTGEGPLPCLTFGALSGVVFFALSANKWAEAPAVIFGALLGTGAGLVYWLLAEKYKTRRAARAAGR